MSGKQNKKFRKELRHMYEKDVEQIARETGHLFKEKPKYVPMRVWIWAMSFFIRVRSTPK